jgi:hypothetical protein
VRRWRQGCIRLFRQERKQEIGLQSIQKYPTGYSGPCRDCWFNELPAGVLKMAP